MLGSPDILVQLQSGGIDAFITSPVVVASDQYFAVADNMTDLRWAPFVGGLLVSLATWGTIPADLRPRLAQAAIDVADSYQKEILSTDAEAITAMKRYGLVVHEVPPAAREAWKQLLARGVDAFIGKNVDRQYYDTASRYLEELRRTGAGR
jgi:TRAP-type C4-dicarboxylate transport system substrate-binding protein